MYCITMYYVFCNTMYCITMYYVFCNTMYCITMYYVFCNTMYCITMYYVFCNITTDDNERSKRQFLDIFSETIPIRPMTNGDIRIPDISICATCERMDILRIPPWTKHSYPHPTWEHEQNMISLLKITSELFHRFTIFFNHVVFRLIVICIYSTKTH